MESAASTELGHEVHHFREWANRRAGRFGEWECDYENWGKMYDACIAHLNQRRPEQWESKDVELLLYALARDNECERLKEELIERPAHLLALAKAALGPYERDARWQLADALAGIGQENSDANDLLEQFVLDQDEYVSRRALLALGQLKSPSAERLAVRAWETGMKYQRIAALSVLADISSPLLSEYLALAEEDGRDSA